MQTVRLRFTGNDNNEDTAKAFTIGKVYDVDSHSFKFGYLTHDDEGEPWFIESDDRDFEIFEE